MCVLDICQALGKMRLPIIASTVPAFTNGGITMSSRTTEASKRRVCLGLIAALTASTGIVAKEAKHVTEPEVRYSSHLLA